MLPQRATRVAHVPAEVGEPAQGIGIARLLASQREVAEPPRCFALRFVARHPALDVLVNALIEMEARLFVEIG